LGLSWFGTRFITLDHEVGDDQNPRAVAIADLRGSDCAPLCCATIRTYSLGVLSMYSAHGGAASGSTHSSHHLESPTKK
jgi:hypothetical protein